MNQETQGHIFSFLKFGSEKNSRDLYENGTIYFNTIDYFQILEEQELRGDNYEGTTVINNYHEYENVKYQIKFQDREEPIEIHPTELHVREYMTETLGNLYSLFSIKTPDIFVENYQIDKRVKKFGDYFVMIKDLPRFLENIYSTLTNLKISYKSGVVRYYDKKRVNGEITFFDKSLEYEYQKEFRIFIVNKKNNPFSIKIGSLEEYAELFPIEAIDTFQIKFKNKTAPNNDYKI